MIKKFDFLVIGSGIAGLNFALKAADHGRVAIVTKKELIESNSNYAQGGIAAVLDPLDNFKSHVNDTLKAGCNLNNKKAVEIMIKDAPRQIQDLVDLGVGFNRVKGKLTLSKEGAHSKNRIVFAKDITGKEIERALVFNVRQHKNISIFESNMALDLFVKNKVCIGAAVLDISNNKINKFFTKTTILATGGVGQVYKNNTNPKIATGDGVAMAERAGAKIVDMEFMQFHPTALSVKNKPHFLISERLRGENARLLNVNKKSFMKKYHKLKELAPRDVVARAIWQEMKKGPVYIDATKIKKVKDKFPYIYEQLWWQDIKMDKDLIPISPAAHYLCGGVKTDNNGKTSIAGLYAFGEVAGTGVHGANRLASNSLLECLVFSSRALKSSARFIKNKIIKIINIKNKKINKNIDSQINSLKQKIKLLMWNNVGIVRSQKKMTKTLLELEKIAKKVDQLYNKGANRNVVELRNLNTVAILITKAALNREKSIGSHFINN